MKRTISWRGPPLAFQIMVLLLGVLVAAQLATLCLTLLLPPAPKVQYGLEDVAALLAGEGSSEGSLRRTVQAGPPDISGPGWLVAERSRLELAQLVGVRPGDVALAFYTPLPFAGTTTPRPYAMADDGPVAPFGGARMGAVRPIALALQEGAMPSMPAMPMERDRDRALPPRDNFPPGFSPMGGRRGEAGRFDIQRGDVTGRDGFQRPLISIAPNAAAARPLIPGDGGAAVPALLRGAPASADAAARGGESPLPRIDAPPSVAQRTAEAVVRTQALDPVLGSPAPPPGFPPGLLARGSMPDRTLLALPPASPVRVAPPVLIAPQPAAPLTTATPLRPAPQPFVMPAPALSPPPTAAPREDATPMAPPAGPPIRVAPVPRGLFGFAPAPFVEGDFVAALRLRDGRWAVVQPAPEPFPNSWQRRVLLWFALSLALIAPLGWLFARRLVKPLERFAGAAEQLGRDPKAEIGALDGPAEIGRAAHAFNIMQTRLRTFVDDRTAMIGAISHDLRTPLTRMRFRIEDAPDEVREGLLEEVDDMEAMIAEVIAFLRDASTPGARERCDLSALVEDVVEDARLVGSDVTVESAVGAPVEVDVLGMRRLLDNLLENAVKYGHRARVRVSTEGGSAIAEVIDEGPGLPDDEIEHVFEPFYRSEAARASNKAGSGLGLAVCRSIARAHGGDVQLVNATGGLCARMRVPLAFGPVPAG